MSVHAGIARQQTGDAHTEPTPRLHMKHGLQIDPEELVEVSLNQRPLVKDLVKRDLLLCPRNLSGYVVRFVKPCYWVFFTDAVPVERRCARLGVGAA